MRISPPRAGSEAAAVIEDIDRRTLAMASAILVITTTIGLFAAGPFGILLGPLVDNFLTPRVLASRKYKSPGAPLWSAAVGAVAMLPAIRSGSSAEDVRNFFVPRAIGAAFGAVILGVIALRTPLAKLGAIGIGLGVAAAVVTIALASQAS
jgi:hypothetical protein